jgi:hypothetical protein
MSTLEVFTVYDEWEKAAQEAGFDGPHQIQGFSKFEFREGKDVVAFWDGSIDQGTVRGVEASSLHHTIEPVHS